MSAQDKVGPWEARGDSGHNNRPFYKLVRRNPAWGGHHYGTETALTPKGAIRRFYDKEKAVAEAAKRNAVSNATGDATGSQGGGT